LYYSQQRKGGNQYLERLGWVGLVGGSERG